MPCALFIDLFWGIYSFGLRLKESATGEVDNTGLAEDTSKAPVTCKPLSKPNKSKKAEAKVAKSVSKKKK